MTDFDKYRSPVDNEWLYRIYENENIYENDIYNLEEPKKRDFMWLKVLENKKGNLFIKDKCGYMVVHTNLERPYDLKFGKNEILLTTGKLIWDKKERDLEINWYPVNCKYNDTIINKKKKKFDSRHVKLKKKF